MTTALMVMILLATNVVVENPTGTVGFPIMEVEVIPSLADKAVQVTNLVG